MPLYLTTLDIQIKVLEPDAVIDQHDTLDVFNRFYQLESLKVICVYLDDYGAGELHGDSELPCLQKLELSMRDATVIAHDLSFSKIPDSCSVICDLEVETDSAKHKLQQ